MNLKEYLKQKIKAFSYILEAIIVKFGLWLFSSMKPQNASNVGSTIAKFVGKKISTHKLAYNNISRAMPNLSEIEKDKILDDMWDNLGRIVGEFPHIAKCPTDKISDLVGMSEETRRNIETLSKNGKGGVIFGAHIGNWEIGPKFFMDNGMAAKAVYRPLNNPYVEKMTGSRRGVDLIEKGIKGSRKIIEVIKEGGFVIIMADQKISEGEPVKFFNDDAITTTSIARIALKYDVPLIPARSVRIGKEFKFRLDVEKPLAIQKSGDINLDSLNLTRDINCKLEEWITQYPSQWFWVHNRWKR